MNPFALFGVLVYSPSVSGDGMRTGAYGGVVRVTLRRVSRESRSWRLSPRTLDVEDSGQFESSVDAAIEYVAENGWWDSTASIEVDVVDDSREVVSIQGPSLGAGIAMCLAKLFVGDNPDTHPSIGCCDLSSIAVSAQVVPAGRGAISRVGEIETKIPDLLKAAARLGIDAVVVAADQDGLDSKELADFVYETDGTPGGLVFSAKNRAGEWIHPVRVFKAGDLGAAFEAIAAAQAWNVLHL